MNYFYDKQLVRYIVQFMAIFKNLTIQTGNTEAGTKIIQVPVQYGSKDKVAASILNDNTQNLPLRLPNMSVYLRNIDTAPDRYKGIDSIRKINYLPRGGIFPDDIKTVTQLMPIPYNTTMDLSIYSNNQNTQFQILEQILILFNPILQIQTSDAPFDWTRLTTVELKNINFEENYPSSTDRRMIITTLSFDMPVYLTAPTALRNDIIKEIFLRVGAVGDSIDTNSYDIIEQLNSLDVDYEHIISASEYFSPEKI